MISVCPILVDIIKLLYTVNKQLNILYWQMMNNKNEPSVLNECPQKNNNPAFILS